MHTIVLGDHLPISKHLVSFSSPDWRLENESLHFVLVFYHSLWKMALKSSNLVSMRRDSLIEIRSDS